MMRKMLQNIARGMAFGIAGISLALVSAMGVDPAVAMAGGVGRIHIKESLVDDGQLPSSTVMIYDSMNVVVGKSVNDQGLTEFDLPSDLTGKLTPNKTYTITAMADGYTFSSKTGTLAENVDVIVELVGTRTITVRVVLKAEGVNDFSYVRAAIYEGTNVTASPQSTATPSPQGTIEFKDVPVGANYTIMLTCPSNLAGQLPELTQFSVDAGQKETQEVEIQGTAASLDSEDPVVTSVPEPVQKYEAPVKTEAETAPRPVSTQPIAQTGDAVLVVTLSVIGVAVVAIAVLIIRRK